MCVCLSVCQLLLVRAITHHTYQLESPDLDRKIQNILLKVPIVFGADWDWLFRSNLASCYNSVYLHRFCVFEIFVRRSKTEFVELFHIPHESAHMLITIYARRQSRAMDREAVYFYIFVRPSQFCQPLTRRLVVDFTSCWQLSPNYRHLTYYDFILQNRQSPKQLLNSFLLPVFCLTSTGFGRGFVSASAIVSVVVNTRVFAHGTPSLFHILTSFVRISPISTLINRPSHGLWRGLRDSAGNSMRSI